MARNKSQEKKEHLTSAINKNERAPVWVYLKTKSRDLIRGRKRHWRNDKLGKKIKKKEKMSAEYKKPANPKKKISNKRTRKGKKAKKKIKK